MSEHEASHDLADGRLHSHGTVDPPVDHDSHGHSHGSVDPSIAASRRGVWAVKWSFVILSITAAMQFAIVIWSNSVALLADTIHNFGDAATAIPLAIAFLFARRRPTRRFSYGYGRVEDLAGMIVVLTILASAVVAAYESTQRLIHPQTVSHLGAVAAAALIGFLGNEAVAIFRIRVGREIGSVALVADGYHARTDGWTSLAVLFGAMGVWAGYPMADPIIGMLITVAILFIVWKSAREVLSRALDGVDPRVLDDLRQAARRVRGVREVKEVRARWLGHQLLAEINIGVESKLSVEEAHGIGGQVQQELSEQLKFLSRSIVQVGPIGASEKGRQLSHSHSHEAGHPR